jgi:hypothetical protein
LATDMKKQYLCLWLLLLKSKYTTIALINLSLRNKDFLRRNV